MIAGTRTRGAQAPTTGAFSVRKQRAVRLGHAVVTLGSSR